MPHANLPLHPNKVIMESGKGLPEYDGGRSSSEREFECKGCGAKNVVRRSEGAPTSSPAAAGRKRRSV